VHPSSPLLKREARKIPFLQRTVLLFIRDGGENETSRE